MFRNRIMLKWSCLEAATSPTNVIWALKLESVDSVDLAYQAPSGLRILPGGPGGPRGPWLPTPGLPRSPFSPGRPGNTLNSKSHLVFMLSMKALKYWRLQCWKVTKYIYGSTIITSYRQLQRDFLSRCLIPSLTLSSPNKATLDPSDLSWDPLEWA